MKVAERIPGPKPLPVVGNLLDIDLEHGLQSIIAFADKYGPLFQITINGEKQIFATSQALVDELCDESRFHKAVVTGLEILRLLAHYGLFTAYHGERGWGIAHRILVPAFGPLRIRNMLDDMSDVAQQLCLKWARQGGSTSINITEHFTRLTLDTIALCTMGFRLNSFYNNETMHPFVQSMLYVLKEADVQANLPGIANSTRVSTQRRMHKNIEAMRTMARGIIQERRKNKNPVDDILNTLLNGRDPVTGEGMSDDSIIDNVITFLIAGHETTSGLLSFTFYFLIQHPHILKKAQEEVDETVGLAQISAQHLAELPYIDAILKESLRLMPTAPGFAVTPKKTEVLGGKWMINAGQPVNVLLPACLRDQSVFGPDADEFRPERMLAENFSKLPPNSWKPFGNGERGCIGRAFAWQEAQLVVAMILQTCDLVPDDPSYQLRIKETLTIKPDGFRIRALLRRGQTATGLSRRSMLVARDGSSGESSNHPAEARGDHAPARGQPVSFFYGSNSGTCKALAHQLASNMMSRGFTTQKLAPLDNAVDNLPRDQPVTILTTTYDGQPTDDAKKFVAWLEAGNVPSLQGISYAVFGCGHHDWTQTFYRIPILIDDLMHKAGATRLAPRGAANAAVSDLFSDLEAWEETSLLPALRENFLPSNSTDFDPLNPHQIQLSLSKPRRVDLHKGLIEAKVTAVRVLTSPDTPEKRHLELRFQGDTSLRPGDHLNILPVNPPSTVSRVLAQFNLAPDYNITVNSFNTLVLPQATPVSASELFSSYVELCQPATRNNLKALIAATQSDPDKQELNRLYDSYEFIVRDKRVSVLDLLEQFPSISLPIAAFISMLPALRVRTYSLSMAPSFKPSHSSLTFSVINEPAWRGSGQHLGVASNYLASLTSGSIFYFSPRPAKESFHLPNDPSSTPIIMVCAGSGLAPFLSFIQDRMVLKQQYKPLAKALLFFGCRGRSLDDLYHEELSEFEAAGVVEIRRAYSKTPDFDIAKGCRYVQHRLVTEGQAILSLWSQNAIIYVCGSTNMAKGVEAVLQNMLGPLPKERYVTEIF
ncbi:bifunctional cytochrome P450/NADPH--P450 reductase [Aspergillus neoniger CBS 115656]|uniref:Bifunctional cytochrome P450/NADPH--P450 reductase n=1 Tax=Aspergillus neoniger (strain CBS 115656) TaxID=1448310 RepID=A0A318Z9R9_ASPNB|nr:NADPH cytochrome P450 [Aspergillus neoniger CBS 115656]PYH37028.1 NADPH cytochrome P450 [Aspergillus neoniger CBS 115656]